MAARSNKRGNAAATINFLQAQREERARQAAERAKNTGSQAPQPIPSANLPDDALNSDDLHPGQDDLYGDKAAGVLDENNGIIYSEEDPFGKQSGAVPTPEGPNLKVPTAHPARVVEQPAAPTPPPRRALQTTARPGSAAFRPFRGAQFAAPFRRSGENGEDIQSAFLPAGLAPGLGAGIGGKRNTDEDIAQAVLAVLQQQR